ncbi:MAG: alpha/beta hydrolase [Hyphomicrobiaceae bacterium]|nr:alpha/beta hydrolase [Hyphomicrobiaceae bacterium]
MDSSPVEHQTIDVPGVGPTGLAVYGVQGGYPVLALHGAPACRLMYDVADAPARELGMTLYCPDRPGYGLTPLDRPDRTLRDRAAALEAVVDHLGLDRFAIIGISGGAPYAVALASRVRTRATALLLASPMGPFADYMSATVPATARRDIAAGHRLFFLGGPRRPRLLANGATLASAGFKAAPQLFTRLFARSLGSADRRVLERPRNAASLIRMTRESLRQGVCGGIADLELFARPWGVGFDEVTAPALVCQGTADRIVPAALSVWLADRIPGCTLRRLENAGHFWVYDNARDVLGTLIGLAMPTDPAGPLPLTGQA